MGLTSNFKGAVKASWKGLTSASFWLSGWTALGVGVGVGVIGLYEAFVNGRYDGNIVDQAYQGFVNAMPVVSDQPAFDVIKRDLSAGLVGAGISVVTRLGNIARQGFSGNYSQGRAEAEEKEEISRQANRQVYQAEVAADAAVEVAEIEAEKEERIIDITRRLDNYRSKNQTG